MKVNIFLILLSIVPFLFGCTQEPEGSESNELSGLWSLHIMEQLDTETGEWKEWRNGMQGYILYDNKENMALHLTTRDYEKTEIRFPNFVDSISTDALKHLTNSYVYFAKYTIDQEVGLVQHARISHSNPGDWGKVVQRRYSFIGDTLVLQPVEESTSGLRLKWIKASIQR